MYRLHGGIEFCLGGTPGRLDGCYEGGVVKPGVFGV
jgi:hypothetical protein